MMKKHTHLLQWSDGHILLDCCRIMGILNITPDSFSDGGHFFQLDRAVARAWEIFHEGADILDIGGESTKPGAISINVQEERSRVWPVLEKLKREQFPLPISLDSSKPELIKDAFQNKLIQIVNDVEGLRNPEMVEVIHEFHIPVILMHMFGSPRTMQQEYHYEDVVTDIKSFFAERLKKAEIVDNVVLDPGIGFGKDITHNLNLIHRLREFTSLGHPIMIGASRKTFIGKLLEVDLLDRLEGSLAVAAIAIYNGASMVRVHDVKATRRVVKMVEALKMRNI